MQCDGAPCLEVSNLSFRYTRDHDNLVDISLAIDSGEFVAVMGPNGSGKTTLMKCINRILDIDEGTIRIDGADISGMTMMELARICTTVPADTSVDFALSVRDYISLGRSPFVRSIWWEDEEDERLIEDAMWELGVSNYADRRLQELSSGERARVLLAKGMVQTPRLLLVDEPSAHLDIKYKVQIMEILRDLSRKGLAVMISSHDINLITRFCDRILLLTGGHIIDDGPAKDVVTRESVRDVFGINVDLVESGDTVYVLPTGSAQCTYDYETRP